MNSLIEDVKTTLLVLNTFFSFFMIFIHVKNSKLQKKTYLLNSHNNHCNSTVLDVVECKQFTGYFVVKLAFYNPSSTAAIIRSLSVTKVVNSENFILKYFNIKKSIDIDYSWSPALNDNDFKVVLLKEAYHLLHVKNVATLFVSIKGNADRALYGFEVKTNHNYYKITTDAYTGDMSFSNNFHEWRNN